ncbi:AarF/UbiB family protein, partial [Elusimicrobiota bacterium]
MDKTLIDTKTKEPLRDARDIIDNRWKKTTFSSFVFTHAQALIKGGVSFWELNNIAEELKVNYEEFSKYLSFRDQFENFNDTRRELLKIQVDGKNLFTPVPGFEELFYFNEELSESDIRSRKLKELFLRTKADRAAIQEYINNQVKNTAGANGLGNEFLGNIDNTDNEVRELMYLYSSGGILSIDQFYKVIHGKIMSEDRSFIEGGGMINKLPGNWSVSDLKALFTFLKALTPFQNKRNLVSGEMYSPESWDQYLVPLSLYILEKEFNDEDPPHFFYGIKKQVNNPYQIFLGELPYSNIDDKTSGDSIDYIASKSVSLSENRSADRFNFSKIAKDKLLKAIFNFIDVNPQYDYDYWMDYAEKFIPASSRRNIFLYYIFWMKIMVPKLGLSGDDVYRKFYDFDYIMQSYNENGLVTDADLKGAIEKIAPLLVEDKIFKELNTEGIGEIGKMALKTKAKFERKGRIENVVRFVGTALYYIIVTGYFSVFSSIMNGIAKIGNERLRETLGTVFVIIMQLLLKPAAAVFEAGLGLESARFIRYFINFRKIGYSPEFTAQVLNRYKRYVALETYFQLRNYYIFRFFASLFLERYKPDKMRYKWQYNEPGNISSQIDLVIAYPYKDTLLNEIKAGTSGWKSLLEKIQLYFARPSPVRDELLVELADSVYGLEIEEQFEALDTLHRAMYQPFFKEQYALKAFSLAVDIEEKRTKSPVAFEKEYELLFEYFPDYSFTRDDIIFELMEKAANPLQYSGLNREILQFQENVIKEDARTKIFSENKIRELIQDAGNWEKEELALWVMGLSDKKPYVIKEIEYLYHLDLEYLKELVNQEAPARYSLAGTSIKKDLIESLFGGEDGLIRDRKVLNHFLVTVFDQNMPKDMPDRRTIKKILLTVFRHINDEKKLDILGALSTKLKPGQVNSASQLIGTFFESFGLIGIKLAQIISHSDLADDLDPQIRETLMELSSSADPMGKKNVFQLINMVLGDDFYKYFEAVDERMGSASIKFVYKLLMKPGTIDLDKVVLKIKRPEIDKVIDDELEEMKNILDDLTSQGMNIPKGLGDQLARYLKEEVDFLLERKNRDLFGEYQDSRKKEIKLGEKNVVFTSPKGIPELDKLIPEGFLNTTMFEEIIEGGIELNNDKKLKAELGLSDEEIAELKRIIFHELMDQMFFDGFFHADPHGGNILVRKDESDNIDVVFLDLGSMGRNQLIAGITEIKETAGDFGEISELKLSNGKQFIVEVHTRDKNLLIINPALTEADFDTGNNVDAGFKRLWQRAVEAKLDKNHQLAQWLLYMGNNKGKVPPIPDDMILESTFFKKVGYIIESMDGMEILEAIFSRLGYGLPEAEAGRIQVYLDISKGRWDKIKAGDFSAGMISRIAAYMRGLRSKELLEESSESIISTLGKGLEVMFPGYPTAARILAERFERVKAEDYADEIRDTFKAVIGDRLPDLDIDELNIMEITKMTPDDTQGPDMWLQAALTRDENAQYEFSFFLPLIEAIINKSRRKQLLSQLPRGDAAHEAHRSSLLELPTAELLRMLIDEEINEFLKIGQYLKEGKSLPDAYTSAHGETHSREITMLAEAVALSKTEKRAARVPVPADMEMYKEYKDELFNIVMRAAEILRPAKILGDRLYLLFLTWNIVEVDGYGFYLMKYFLSDYMNKDQRQRFIEQLAGRDEGSLDLFKGMMEKIYASGESMDRDDTVKELKFRNEKTFTQSIGRINRQLKANGINNIGMHGYGTRRMKFVDLNKDAIKDRILLGDIEKYLDRFKTPKGEEEYLQIIRENADKFYNTIEEIINLETLSDNELILVLSGISVEVDGMNIWLGRYIFSDIISDEESKALIGMLNERSDLFIQNLILVLRDTFNSGEMISRYNLKDILNVGLKDIDIMKNSVIKELDNARISSKFIFLQSAVMGKELHGDSAFIKALEPLPSIRENRNELLKIVRDSIGVLSGNELVYFLTRGRVVLQGKDIYIVKFLLSDVINEEEVLDIASLIESIHGRKILGQLYETLKKSKDAGFIPSPADLAEITGYSQDMVAEILRNAVEKLKKNRIPAEMFPSGGVSHAVTKISKELFPEPVILNTLETLGSQEWRIELPEIFEKNSDKIFDILKDTAKTLHDIELLVFMLKGSIEIDGEQFFIPKYILSDKISPAQSKELFDILDSRNDKDVLIQLKELLNRAHTIKRIPVVDDIINISGYSSTGLGRFLSDGVRKLRDKGLPVVDLAARVITRSSLEFSGNMYDNPVFLNNFPQPQGLIERKREEIYSHIERIINMESFMDINLLVFLTTGRLTIENREVYVARYLLSDKISKEETDNLLKIIVDRVEPGVIFSLYRILEEARISGEVPVQEDISKITGYTESRLYVYTVNNTQILLDNGLPVSGGSTIDNWKTRIARKLPVDEESFFIKELWSILYGQEKFLGVMQSAKKDFDDIINKTLNNTKLSDDEFLAFLARGIVGIDGRNVFIIKYLLSDSITEKDFRTIYERIRINRKDSFRVLSSLYNMLDQTYKAGKVLTNKAYGDIVGISSISLSLSGAVNKLKKERLSDGKKLMTKFIHKDPSDTLVMIKGLEKTDELKGYLSDQPVKEIKTVRSQDLPKKYHFLLDSFDDGVLTGKAAFEKSEISRLLDMMIREYGFKAKDLENTLDVMSSTYSELRSKLIGMKYLQDKYGVSSDMVRDANVNIDYTLEYLDSILDNGKERIITGTHQVYFHPPGPGATKKQSNDSIIEEGIGRLIGRPARGKSLDSIRKEAAGFIKEMNRVYGKGGLAEDSIGEFDKAVVVIDTQGYDIFKKAIENNKHLIAPGIEIEYLDDIVKTETMADLARSGWQDLVAESLGNERIRNIIEGVLYSRYVGLRTELEAIKVLTDLGYEIISSGENLYRNGKYVTELDIVVRNPKTKKIFIVECKTSRQKEKKEDVFRDKIVSKVRTYKNNWRLIEKSIASKLGQEDTDIDGVIFFFDIGHQRFIGKRIYEGVTEAEKEKEKALVMERLRLFTLKDHIQKNVAKFANKGVPFENKITGKTENIIGIPVHAVFLGDLFDDEIGLDGFKDSIRKWMRRKENVLLRKLRAAAKKGELLVSSAPESIVSALSKGLEVMFPVYITAATRILREQFKRTELEDYSDSIRNVFKIVLGERLPDLDIYKLKIMELQDITPDDTQGSDVWLQAALTKDYKGQYEFSIFMPLIEAIINKNRRKQLLSQLPRGNVVEEAAKRSLLDLSSGELINMLIREEINEFLKIKLFLEEGKSLKDAYILAHQQSHSEEISLLAEAVALSVMGETARDDITAAAEEAAKEAVDKVKGYGDLLEKIKDKNRADLEPMEDEEIVAAVEDAIMSIMEIDDDNIRVGITEIDSLNEIILKSLQTFEPVYDRLERIKAVIDVVKKTDLEYILNIDLIPRLVGYKSGYGFVDLLDMIKEKREYEFILNLDNLQYVLDDVEGYAKDVFRIYRALIIEGTVTEGNLEDINIIMKSINSRDIFYKSDSYNALLSFVRNRVMKEDNIEDIDALFSVIEAVTEKNSRKKIYSALGNMASVKAMDSGNLEDLKAFIIDIVKYSQRPVTVAETFAALDEFALSEVVSKERLNEVMGFFLGIIKEFPDPKLDIMNSIALIAGDQEVVFKNLRDYKELLRIAGDSFRGFELFAKLAAAKTVKVENFQKIKNLFSMIKDGKLSVAGFQFPLEDVEGKIGRLGLKGKIYIDLIELLDNIDRNNNRYLDSLKKQGKDEGDIKKEEDFMKMRVSDFMGSIADQIDAFQGDNNEIAYWVSQYIYYLKNEFERQNKDLIDFYLQGVNSEFSNLMNIIRTDLKDPFNSGIQNMDFEEIVSSLNSYEMRYLVWNQSIKGDIDLTKTGKKLYERVYDLLFGITREKVSQDKVDEVLMTVGPVAIVVKDQTLLHQYFGEVLNDPDYSENLIKNSIEENLENILSEQDNSQLKIYLLSLVEILQRDPLLKLGLGDKGDIQQEIVSLARYDKRYFNANAGFRIGIPLQRKYIKKSGVNKAVILINTLIHELTHNFINVKYIKSSVSRDAEAIHELMAYLAGLPLLGRLGASQKDLEMVRDLTLGKDAGDIPVYEGMLEEHEAARVQMNWAFREFQEAGIPLETEILKPDFFNAGLRILQNIEDKRHLTFSVFIAEMIAEYRRSEGLPAERESRLTAVLNRIQSEFASVNRYISMLLPFDLRALVNADHTGSLFKELVAPFYKRSLREFWREIISNRLIDIDERSVLALGNAMEVLANNTEFSGIKEILDIIKEDNKKIRITYKDAKERMLSVKINIIDAPDWNESEYNRIDAVNIGMTRKRIVLTKKLVDNSSSAELGATILEELVEMEILGRGQPLRRVLLNLPFINLLTNAVGHRIARRTKEQFLNEIATATAEIRDEIIIVNGDIRALPAAGIEEVDRALFNVFNYLLKDFYGLIFKNQYNEKFIRELYPEIRQKLIVNHDKPDLALESGVTELYGDFLLNRKEFLYPSVDINAHVYNISSKFTDYIQRKSYPLILDIDTKNENLEYVRITDYGTTGVILEVKQDGVSRALKVPHDYKSSMDYQVRRIQEEGRKLKDITDTGIDGVVKFVSLYDKAIMMDLIGGTPLNEAGVQDDEFFRKLEDIAVSLGRVGYMINDLVAADIIVTKTGDPIITDVDWFEKSNDSKRAVELNVEEIDQIKVNYGKTSKEGPLTPFYSVLEDKRILANRVERSVPYHVKDFINMLPEDADVNLFGGAIRDIALDRPVNDWDMQVYMGVDEFRKL